MRCPECGHENDPKFRFCGMCGVSLRLAESERPPRRDSSSIVSGPSFLGLESEPSSGDPRYLLEDDEPSSGRWRLYVALLVLLAASGGLVWHWQLNGYPWQTRPWDRPAVSSTAPIPTEAPAAQAPAADPQPSATSAATDKDPSDEDESADKASNEEDKAEPKSEDKAAAVPQSSPAEASKQPVTKEEQVKDNKAESKSEDVAVLNTSRGTPTRSKAKPIPVKEAAASVPELDPSDALVADGQRYLYGNGVPADCTRARKNLLAAAAQSNPKAQSTVGAMYATGHCVDRDLPTAYRWFAQALHKDPENARVQQDLEVLWRQMSPEERQTALRNR